MEKNSDSPEKPADATTEKPGDASGAKQSEKQSTTEQKPEAPKRSALDRARDLVKSRKTLSDEKGDLASENEQLKKDVADRDATIAEKDQEITALKEEVAKGEDLAKQVLEMEKEKETTSQAAARIAAESHLSSEQVPGSDNSTGDGGSPVEQAREAFRNAKPGREKRAAFDRLKKLTKSDAA
ncbi:MAG: hypothetical protein AAF236_00750 [Verrucomicrobiota bacterium]